MSGLPTAPVQRYLTSLSIVSAASHRTTAKHLSSVPHTQALHRSHGLALRSHRLAKLLTQAVINLHSMNLVHKPIRSRAVLLVVNTDPNNTNQTSPPAQEPSPQLFLQDWTYVRSQTPATSQNGTSDAWQRLLYEHPERQRSRDHFPETDYQLKHEIYSLGVVFMEIFL
jgi:hypothetical protein